MVRSYRYREIGFVRSVGTFEWKAGLLIRRRSCAITNMKKIYYFWDSEPEINPEFEVWVAPLPIFIPKINPASRYYPDEWAKKGIYKEHYTLLCDSDYDCATHADAKIYVTENEVECCDGKCRTDEECEGLVTFWILSRPTQSTGVQISGEKHFSQAIFTLTTLLLNILSENGLFKNTWGC